MSEIFFSHAAPLKWNFFLLHCRQFFGCRPKLPKSARRRVLIASMTIPLAWSFQNVSQ